MVQGLISLNDESYVSHPWHGTLLSIAAITFAIIFNTVLAAKLPLVEGIVLVLHIVGFLGIAVPLWVLAPKASGRVLVEFSDNGGWSSMGIAAMIGLQTPLTALIGYDCSVHMCKQTLFLCSMPFVLD